jgi:hypothetical protein
MALVPLPGDPFDPHHEANLLSFMKYKQTFCLYWLDEPGF